MKIYKLTINKVYEPRSAVMSSFISPREFVSETFYVSKLDAEIVQKQKYQAARELFGMRSDFEALVTEVNVVEPSEVQDG